MEKDFEDIDVAIAKFLAGESSPEESAWLENWRKTSEENQLHFEKAKSLMDAVNLAVNTDLAWNKLEQRMTEEGPARVIPIYRRLSFIRVAAAMFLLAFLGLVARWFFYDTKPETLQFAATKRPVQKTLPDGSKAFINKNSELSYSAGRDGSRHVTLKGEAFFEVRHDAKKPFVVSIDQALIRDIGTAFNVKTIAGANNSIEVWVESGEVQFYSSSNAGLILKAGEKGIYHLGSGAFIKAKPDATENTLSYKTRSFSFKDSPLTEVVDQLNAVYNSDIRLEDKALGNERLSVHFHNESLDMILSIICETLDLKYEKNGASTVLKRKNSSD